MRRQARLRKVEQQQLHECRESLQQHKARSEAETEALRTMLSELKASYDASNQATQARLASLEAGTPLWPVNPRLHIHHGQPAPQTSGPRIGTARASAYSRDLMAAMQRPPPAGSTLTEAAKPELDEEDSAFNLRRLPGAMPPPPDEAPAATTPVKPALFSPVRPRPPPAQPRASPPWRDLTPTGLGAVPCR